MLNLLTLLSNSSLKCAARAVKVDSFGYLLNVSLKMAALPFKFKQDKRYCFTVVLKSLHKSVTVVLMTTSGWTRTSLTFN
jgi:hypothetical protein